MMNGQLLWRVRLGVTHTFKLREESVIGSDKALEVAVPLEGVSSRHARIVFDGASYWIEDLKSASGTFLNGQAVTRNRLRHLDVISLGKEAELVFVVRAAEATAPLRLLAIVRAALVPEDLEGAPYEIAPGEITLGRAPSNNLVVDEAAVSKVHARIERTRDQLVLEDLGSANGTFVNGTRLTAAFLKDGDTVSLGGVETYKVALEMGEVTSASGRHAVVLIPPGAAGSGTSKPRFSAEWKSRLEGSKGERGEQAEVRRWLAAERETPPSGVAPVRPSERSAVLPGLPAKPAPDADATLVPQRRPEPKVPAQVSPPPAPVTPPPAAGPIATVRLTGGGTSLSVTQPGAHEIGRSRDVELRIDHPTVSRKHALLILSDDRAMAYLQDQGGSQGTRHNGREVEKLAPLADGDTVGIGELVLTVSIDRG